MFAGAGTDDTDGETVYERECYVAVCVLNIVLERTDARGDLSNLYQFWVTSVRKSEDIGQRLWHAAMLSDPNVTGLSARTMDQDSNGDVRLHPAYRGPESPFNQAQVLVSFF